MSEVLVASERGGCTSCIYLACTQCGRWCGPLAPFTHGYGGQRMRLTGITCSDCTGTSVMWSGVPDDGGTEAPIAE